MRVFNAAVSTFIDIFDSMQARKICACFGFRRVPPADIIEH